MVKGDFEKYSVPVVVVRAHLVEEEGELVTVFEHVLAAAAVGVLAATVVVAVAAAAVEKLGGRIAFVGLAAACIELGDEQVGDMSNGLLGGLLGV